MDILSNLLWTLSCFTIIYTVRGYSGGNFPQSCESMLVIHERNGENLSPQLSNPPFEIAVTGGPDPITVTLRSTGHEPFRGFMLEARNNDSIVGKFIITDSKESRLLNCNGLTGSAVSQRRNSQKYLLRVNWTSETENLEDVTFRATFLQDFYIFWGPENQVKTTPGPSTTPSTSIPTDTTAVTVPSTAESTTKHTTPSTSIPTDTTAVTVPSTAETTTKHTTPGTSIPTDTTAVTVPSTTKHTTPQTTESGTTKHSNGTTTISTNPELTRTPVVNTTSQPPATNDSLSPSDNSTRKRSLHHIEKYTPEMTAEVSLGTFVVTVPAIVASNAKNHRRRKWIRRCGSILVLALEITAFVLLFFYDKLLNLKLIALSMSVTGAVTLALAFWDIGLSHELWPLYDNVIDVLFLIQKGLAIAFIYCCTGHCQPWLLYVLISFTVWVLLQITYIFTVKILKLTGSRNKKGTDWKQKCHGFGATVSTVLNVGFCAVIIVGICQC